MLPPWILSLIEPLRLCLALGPLAVYFLLLGAINLSRRPFLVSGGRDLAALALATAGLAVIGPFALFLPEDSIVVFGPAVWLLALTLYVLLATMVILVLRPRLVIYNITADKLRPILADVVERLDRDARWAGDSLVLPTLGVQLHLDSFGIMKSVSLKSTGSGQNYQGWKMLETSLSDALDQTKLTRNPRGLGFLALGLLIAAFVVLAIGHNPQSLSQTLADTAANIMKLFGR
jgi:hypothetical protein